MSKCTYTLGHLWTAMICLALILSWKGAFSDVGPMPEVNYSYGIGTTTDVLRYLKTVQVEIDLYREKAVGNAIFAISISTQAWKQHQ